MQKEEQQLEKRLSELSNLAYQSRYRYIFGFFEFE